MWLLPSRRRPANLARFFAAYRATGGTTPGMVLISTADYAEHCVEYDRIELPLGWFIHYTSGETQGDKLREIWDEVRACAWLGLIGDDCVPETPGWDKELVDRLDGTNFVYCDDGWQAPARIGNCWVIAGELVRAVGYIFPPGLHHLFVDDVWEIVGREAACAVYRSDVQVRHRHVLKGEAPADDTHKLVYGSATSDRTHGLWATDTTVFGAWLEGDRHRAVAAIRALTHPRITVRGEASDGAAADAETAARLAYAKTRSVMIATPIARQPAWQYTLAYAETLVMLEQLGIRYSSRFVVGSSNLPRARNELVARFLTAGFDDLVLIDDDMGWAANDVLRLLASAQPVIAAVGRKKVDKPNTDPNVWCAYIDPGPKGELVQDDAGMVEVRYVGTGMIKISRTVFEEMIKAHPEWKRPGTPEMPDEVKANYYNFFRFDPDDRWEMGEDFCFCQRWRDLGGRVWIDPSINLSHVGEKAYSGAISEIMQAA